MLESIYIIFSLGSKIILNLDSTLKKPFHIKNNSYKNSTIKEQD